MLYGFVYSHITAKAIFELNSGWFKCYNSTVKIIGNYKEISEKHKIQIGFIEGSVPCIMGLFL